MIIGVSRDKKAVPDLAVYALAAGLKDIGRNGGWREGSPKRVRETRSVN